MASPTQGMWTCKHGVDGRDWCEKCHAPDGGLADEAAEVERAFTGWIDEYSRSDAETFDQQLRDAFAAGWLARCTAR